MVSLLFAFSHCSCSFFSSSVIVVIYNGVLSNHAVDAHGGLDECERVDTLEVDVSRGVCGVLGSECDEGLAPVGLADVLHDDVIIAVNVV